MNPRVLLIGAFAAIGLLLTGCDPCSKESGTICTIAGTGEAALGEDGQLATETELSPDGGQSWQLVSRQEYRRSGT